MLDAIARQKYTLQLTFLDTFDIVFDTEYEAKPWYTGS